MNKQQTCQTALWGVLAVLLLAGGWLLGVNRRLSHRKTVLLQSHNEMSDNQTVESSSLETPTDRALALIKEEITACREDTEEEFKKKFIFVHRLLLELRRLQEFDGKNLEDIMNEQLEPGYLEKRKAAVAAATRGGLEKLDRILDDLKTENLEAGLGERLGNFQTDLQKLREDVSQQPQSSDERRELARNLHQQYAYSIVPEILEKHWGKEVEKHDFFLQQLFNISTLYPIRQPIE